MEETFGEAYSSLSADRRSPGSTFIDNFEAAKLRLGSEVINDDTLNIKSICMEAASSAGYDADKGLLLLPR
jgi:hypothetical protein